MYQGVPLPCFILYHDHEISAVGRAFTVSGVRVEDRRIGVGYGGGGGGVGWDGVERMGSGGVRCG